MTKHPIDIEAIHQEYLSDPNQDNLDRLIKSCESLNAYYAKLYGGGYIFEDICQCGYEGLFKAIKNFDPSMGVRFVTYASHGMIGEMKHYIRRERRYYYPQYLENYQQKLDEIVDENLEKGADLAPNEELAQQLNLTPESLSPVMKAGLVHLGNLEVAHIKNMEMESFTLPVEDKLLISQLMYHLTGLQKDVIQMLFHEGMTQEEVAKELGLTQKQVSRIKLKSLQKMKENHK